MNRGKIPLFRRWLGDVEYDLFVLDDTESEAAIAELKRTYPEAIVIRQSEFEKKSPNQQLPDPEMKE